MGGPSHNTGEKLRGRFVLSDAPRASSNTPGLVGDYIEDARNPPAWRDTGFLQSEFPACTNWVPVCAIGAT
jgi:hypothetical protein